MNLTKYKKESPFEFSRRLANYMGMSSRDREHIEEFINGYEYEVVYYEPPEKSHFVYRLLFPVWLLYFLFVCISMPIKWLFTGTRYYRKEHVVNRINEWWIEKLNL